ncbi:MAG TPA: molybdopterin-dependent oxidoreductase [Thermoanaerobaculia bacterium]|nr:molybdopterin-dependent oxidoreductase [Thermoanaerobaculia bacterium]
MAQPLSSSQVLPSACPLDCPDACSLEVRVQDGKVVKIDGTRRNPLTEGYICSKVRRFPELMYGEDRVLHPAVRVGRKGEGRFEQISWDQALDLAASRMREARDRWGGESILPFSYGGSNGILTQDTTDARLFYRLGASRLARTVCAAATGRAATGLYGKMPGIALPDYVHSKLIVVWGVNPSASGIHLVPILQEAQRRGAALVVIDPRRTPLAKKADLHLAPRPGTDLPLALSIHRFLFEEGLADWNFLNEHTHGAEELRRRAQPWTFERAAEVTGIPAEDIAVLARMYAESSPAAIRCGWGLERNRNGGSAVAAVLALPAVGGKFGVRGGGYTLSNSGAFKFDQPSAVREPEPATRVINMNHLGRTLVEERNPPVQVLFVYNCNALATMPNQELVRRGLEREDLFTVVFEQVWTDTARYADLVLPATTFLEHREVSRGYGSMLMQRADAVAVPAGEARPNYEVFGDLCRRLDLSRPGEPETAEELEEALVNQRLRDDLDRDSFAFPDTGWAPIQFGDSFPLTPDRKGHLLPEALDREAPFGMYTYQEDLPGLALISPASSRTISSYLGNLYRDLCPLEMHPEDAALRGISDGDEIRVWNAYGEVRVKARLTRDVKPGVVVLPKGLWSHQTLSGTTANAVAPDTLTDLGRGACFNDARVEVARV